MPRTKAVKKINGTLPLLPDLAEDSSSSQKKSHRLKKNRVNEVLESFKSKLKKVYLYQEKDFIVPSKLPRIEREPFFEYSLVVYSEVLAPFMIIDCASENPEDALASFNSSLRKLPKSTQYALWTNSSEHLFLLRSGENQWKQVPDIPRRGESIDKTGQLLRSSLFIPDTLLTEFSDIRNHLAANATGVTRDEIIATEVLKLLLCKLYDERNTKSDEYVKFCASVNESSHDIKKRIEQSLLEKVVHSTQLRYPKEIGWNETIKLDADSVAYIVGLLQRYDITQASRDIVGQAFESLIGPALRGEEGQFFTPRNVVRMAVALAAPKPGERVMDPACGSGGFLAVVSEYVYKQLAQNSQRKNFNPSQSNHWLYGIDKDSFLTTVAQAYMTTIGEMEANIFCEDSLKPPEQWKEPISKECAFESFDIIVTNPPFGSKIPVKGRQTLEQFVLARNWKKQKDKTFVQTENLVDFRPPQILFIERCLNFLKEGGRMAIVLPDGILGNVNDGYVRQFVSTRADVIAVIDCPLETFLPSTSTKTSVVLLRKKKKGSDIRQPVFMAIAEKCGHNRRGKSIYRENGVLDDDLLDVEIAFEKWRAKHGFDF